MNKRLFNKIGKWENSRQGKSVLDLFRVKIQMGKLKAVYDSYSY